MSTVKANYRLPLQFERLLEGEDLIRCDEKSSIDQNLELIITTCPGEHKYDPDFGCRIWELDFVSMLSQRVWENTFRTHIFEAIGLYEPRITNVELEVYFTDVVRSYPMTGTNAIKKKVTIIIGADLLSSGEKCGFKYSLYLGPLSMD